MTIDWGFGAMYGLMWIPMLLGVAFWVLLIVGLFYGIRWLMRADRNSRLPPGPGAGAGGVPDDPLEILRQRYARGEIDEEEFERRKRTLTGR
jgi:putative membrane protein